MPRGGQHCVHRAALDHFPVAHDGDVAGHLANDGEVVAGEEHGQLALLLKRFEHVEYLGLDGNVERGGRLVGEQQLRLVDEGHGDQYALTLAARELMGIIVHAAGGVGNGYGFEGLNRLVSKRNAAYLWSVSADGLDDLAADLHDRIERGHRLLEYHGDLAAAHGTHFFVGQADQFPA
uniref:Uncharacterized protein n=1 Tax=mine drainage metagenome TaxID=410659 RepID=E6QKD8_9ZZZZ